jgi:hypothetical protein
MKLIDTTLKKTLLTAAFVLATSALFAQSANIQSPSSTSIKISALPFNITAPGTYVLTANLASPLTTYGLGAINISTPIAGPVVLDLKGFTLTGNGVYSTGVSIGYNDTFGNTAPITIRNGTLTNFGYGVNVFSQGKYTSDITVNNIVFNPSLVVLGNGGCGVRFDGVNSSNVNNCIFNGAYQAVLDQGSLGGNSYNNDTFNGVGYALVLGEGQGSAVLNHCQFSAPPAN